MLEKLKSTAIKVGATAVVADIAIHALPHNPFVEASVPTVGVALGKGTDLLAHNNEDMLGREHATGVSWLVRGLSIAGSAFMWRFTGPNEVTLFTTGIAVGSTEKAVRNGLSAGKDTIDTLRFRRMVRRLEKVK